MKIVIAGSRHYNDYAQAEEFIKACIMQPDRLGDITVLSGGCRGADTLGERYAAEHGIAVERYLPNWRRYGKGAGLKRNREMVDACDAVICFWDGESRGTKSLVEYAHRMGKPVFVKMISP